MALHAPEDFNGAKLLGVFESGTSEWHEARAEGIGGSEVGTILGLNPWESPYYLWALKTGQLPPKVLDSFAIKLGNVLEPVILDTLLPQAHPDWEIYRTGTYQHPTLPFLHANPDALAKIDGEWVVVEVKTSRNYWNETPPHYEAQVRHYMNVLGIKRGVIVGLVAMDWVETWIEHDDFEAKVIEQKATEFWKMVQEGMAPDFDGSESTYTAVRELHPLIDGTEVEIDGLHGLAIAQEKFERAEAEFKKIKSEVLAIMGNAQHAYVQFGDEKIRVASRQARNGGTPFLVIRKNK
jgi:putative phage-type endonuclease